MHGKEDCAWEEGEGGLCPSTPTVDLASQVLLGPFLSPGQVQRAAGFTKRDKGLFWEVRPPGSQSSPLAVSSVPLGLILGTSLSGWDLGGHRNHV